MEGITRERAKAIAQGAEPTSTEKVILTDLYNRRLREKALREEKTKQRKLKYEDLKNNLKKAKTDKNQRRNMRKKLRR